MSLISDALKKAQQERDKQPRDDEQLFPVEEPSPRDRYPVKRLVFYSAFIVVILLVVLYATIFYQPDKKPAMTALNVRPQSQNQPQSSSQVQQPQSVPQQIQQNPTSDISQQSPSTASQETPPQEHSEHAKNQPEPNQTTKPPATQNNKNKPQEKPSPSEPQELPKASSQKSTVPAETLPPPPAKSTRQEPKPKPVAESIVPSKTQPSKAPDSEEYIQQGDEHMDEGNYPLAVEEYKKALALKKTSGTYLKLYSAFTLMKNSVLAKAYIEDGVVQFPDDFFLNKLAAIQCIRARDFRKALTYAQTAIKTDNKDYAIFTYLGLCYFHLGNYPKGLENFQASLQLNSDAVENYYYIGLIFDNQKEYKKALEYYRVFFKLNPQDKNFKHHKWVTSRMKLLQQYIEQQ